MKNILFCILVIVTFQAGAQDLFNYRTKNEVVQFKLSEKNILFRSKRKTETQFRRRPKTLLLYQKQPQ